MTENRRGVVGIGGAITVESKTDTGGCTCESLMAAEAELAEVREFWRSTGEWLNWRYYGKDSAEKILPAAEAELKRLAGVK